MSSRGKKKTTMAKLSRESRLRERRVEKNARKNARKEAAANGTTELSGLETSDLKIPDRETSNLEIPDRETSNLETSNREANPDEFAHVAPHADSPEATGP
ncbi:MAG: hypothetical protein ACR2GZ_07245 [Solirubrobacteraceae bacterium]